MEIAKKNYSEMDLTTGNLFIKIIKFVLPLMMASFFQLLYTTVDLWTVSKFGGGPLSMTAIGSNGSVIGIIIIMLSNLASGSNITISIAKGANDKDKAQRIFYTSLIIAFVGGIIIGAIGIVFSPGLLRLMDTPSSIMEKSIQYLRIYFIGIPVAMIYNFGSSMLRALGDSKRPLIFLVISGIVNVVFDFIFVYFFNLDVKGVAYATVLSECVSAFLVLWWFKVNPKNGFVTLKFKEIKLYTQEFKEILKIGIPSGIQGIAYSLPNLLIQSSLYSIEDYYIQGVLITQNEIISGSAASAQVEGYMMALVGSFCSGMGSFIGQNYGALKKDNIKKSYWYSFTWMAIFWLFSIMLVIFGSNQLLGIFMSDTEDINVDAAILAGKQRLYVMTLTYLMNCMMSMDGGYLSGLKHTIPPAIITLMCCTGVRILFLVTIFKLPYFHNILWLYAVFPISWTLAKIIYTPTILIYKKKAEKIIDDKLALINE